MRLKLNTEYWIILISIVCKLVFQLIATANSGYHGDEVMHIDAGNHLAFGYMDFPPLIGIFSWIQNWFDSHSLYINHLFIYINSIAILLFCGLMAIRLGGGVLAVLITELTILFSPGFSATQYLFLPTAFEQLFWVLFIFNSLLFSETGNFKYVFYISAVAALGFLNKYSIVFLFAGFAISVLLCKRNILKHRSTWLALFLFLVLISPNVVWQFANGFPVIHHMAELYQSQLDQLSFWKEFAVLVLFLNPLTIFLWLPAIILPFHPRFKENNLSLAALIFAAVLLLLSKGKNYYFFPIILCLTVFGAVYFEYVVGRRKWIGYVFVSILVATSLYLLPHGIPMLKLDTYLSVYNLKPNGDNKTPLIFENYYSNTNWERIFLSLSDNFEALSEGEKANCMVWGRHYGMAGHVNVFQDKYNLPPAFSFHSSYFTWVPKFDKNITVFAIGEANIDHSEWEKYFDSVEEIDSIENDYATEKNWYRYRIFLCRGIKYNSAEMKELFQNNIY